MKFSMLSLMGVAATAVSVDYSDLAESNLSDKDLMLESLIMGEAQVKNIVENAHQYVSKSDALKHYSESLHEAFHPHEVSLLQTDANVTTSSAPVVAAETTASADSESDASIDAQLNADAEADTAKPKTKLNDKSVAKAVKILNGMIENAQEEIDKVVITCVAFIRRERKRYYAIISDMARLGAEMANLDRVKAASATCISESEANTKEIEQKMRNAKGAYKRQYALDNAELTVKMNDLAVADFIMKITECKHAKKMSKKYGPKSKKLLIQKEEGEEGEEATYSFDDDEIQQKLDSLMHDQSKHLLANVLSASFEGKKVVGADLSETESPLAVDYDEDDVQEEKAHESYEASDVPEEVAAQDLSFVQLEESTECAMSLAETESATDAKGNPKPRRRQARKCTRGRVNMCLINDNMSLMWGEFKDAVDELKDEMKKKENAHENEMKDMNEQSKTETDTKNKCADNLSEATGRRNQATEEQAGKQDEKVDLIKNYRKVVGECRMQLHELVYTKMCGARIVRAEVSERGTKFTPMSITDCEVSNFTPGKCKRNNKLWACDPKKKGTARAGKTILTREVIQKNNKYGTGCPRLTYPTECNAFLCPVHCKMSSWSAYGKCTKECEGGTKLRTRRITRQPLNGGRWCEATTENQPCNTMSCDRNCRLHWWTKKTPCSQACDGGFNERFRRIRVPTRGRGRCWKKHSKTRYRKYGCNKKRCYGDEVCIGKVDLIVALDGSGSFRKTKFALLKNYTGELIKRFRSRYAKRYAMKVGIVQFGNGHIITDKKTGATSVAPAIIRSPLTYKLKKLVKKVKKMEWLGGFTNMAQAFSASKKLFVNGGRKRAQSQVVVVSDGQPSFLFETKKAVDELKDGGVHVNMVTVHPQKHGKQVKLMKEWASTPWKTHMVFVPGVKGLMQNSEKYVLKTIVQFCPRSWSKKWQQAKDKAQRFVLVRERRDCLAWWWRLHKYCRNGKCYGKRQCAAAAKKAGANYFVIYTIGNWSRWYRGRSFCYGHKKNDGKCTFKTWWWPSRKGFWTPSVYSIYAKYGLKGADAAKKLFFVQKDGKDTTEVDTEGEEEAKTHGVRPQDGQPGSMDEEAVNGPLDNDWEEDMDDDTMDDDADDSEDEDEVEVAEAEEGEDATISAAQTSSTETPSDIIEADDDSI